LFQHLFWFFGHPEVYIIALPAFGIISELISCHARKNIFGYNMMVWALIAIAAISFIVWAHHMYVAGMNPYLGFFFATTTLIIAVPTAIKVYNWALTLWHANIKMTVPMLYCLAFLITFLIGGLTGLFLGNVSADVPLSDTYFVVGHFHMVMAVSPVLALYGGLYHWFPSITGRMLDDRLGKIHFWITFIGTYLIYFPMHYIGFLGVPRRYYSNKQFDFIPESVGDLNQFITICALIVGAAQFILLYNFVVSAIRGRKAPKNPWGSCTLEWQTLEAPPGHGNWGDRLPVVYRWPYEYGLPGATDDFVPQNVPDEQIT
jgi:cytochrome c oxidase subunit 1